MITKLKMVFISFLLLMTFTANAGGIQEPTSVKGILANINYAIQHKSLLNEKNYNDEYFQQIFGSPPRYTGDSNETKHYGFFILAKDLNLEQPTEAENNNIGIGIDIDRYPKQGKVNHAQVSIQLDTLFSLKIEDLTPIFGKDWREDVEAENEVFMAQTREPFNPPFPEAIDPMGNKIINYSIGKNVHDKISVDFTPSGKVWRIFIIQYPD